MERGKFDWLGRKEKRKGIGLKFKRNLAIDKREDLVKEIKIIKRLGTRDLRGKKRIAEKIREKLELNKTNTRKI